MKEIFMPAVRAQDRSGFVSAGFTNAKPGLHTGGSNYLLADGHVEWFRPSGVSCEGNAVNSTEAQSPLKQAAEDTAGSVDAAAFSTI